jgi:hypothetical protein
MGNSGRLLDRNLAADNGSGYSVTTATVLT